jgi:hypothetical protein
MGGQDRMQTDNARLIEVLRREPHRANWQIARELGVKRTAVASMRAVLEAQEQIPKRPAFRVPRVNRSGRDRAWIDRSVDRGLAYVLAALVAAALAFAVAG